MEAATAAAAMCVLDHVIDDGAAHVDERGIPPILFLVFVSRLAVPPQTDNFHCHHEKNNFLGVP